MNDDEEYNWEVFLHNPSNIETLKKGKKEQKRLIYRHVPTPLLIFSSTKLLL